MERNGGLEVEVVQARGLTMKPGSKGPPGLSVISLWALFFREYHLYHNVRCFESKFNIYKAALLLFVLHMNALQASK